MTPQWIHRAGWGVSHVLVPGTSEVFRGEVYAVTECGRRVRSDSITAAGQGDRCKTCEKRSKR